MRDTDEPCKWTISINAETKFDFQNTFLNLTFKLKSNVVLKVVFRSKNISEVKYRN